MSSAIYDLGYQRYTGKRHGRAHSIRTLWWFSVRAAYGMGRGEQARRMPIIVSALVFLPALIQIGIASATSMINFISYGNYLEFSALAIGLFVASQAPELIVNDKQNGTLSLYLSRPIRASDYALAKLAALTTATMVLTLGPMLVMFTAKVFLPESPWAAFKEEWTKLFPIVAGSLLISLFFGAVALALSSYAVKRAFATASVIAFFMLTPALYAVAQSVTSGAVRRWSVMLNPVLVVSGLSKWLFELEASRRSAVGRADLPGSAYLWMVLAMIAVSTFVLFFALSQERSVIDAIAGRTPSSVKLTNVSRWYGNVVAVNDVSFTLGPGVTGLLGPNGAGKTTILHMMAGLLRPSAGDVLIDSAHAAGSPDVYHKVGLIPERESVHDYLSGFEFVRACARLHGLSDPDEAARKAIDLVEMAPPQHRRISTYSKGMRQRIKVAGAMVHDPAVLLLDEPFNGMDPRQRVHMLDVLRNLGQQGRVIVISSHILEELNDLATNILVMVSGRLAASGHFREIRRLMTDRPHTFRVRSSDDRKLAAALLADQSVFSVELGGDGIVIRTGERGTLTRNIARAARDTKVRVTEIRPTDESLESVFAYLVSK